MTHKKDLERLTEKSLKDLQRIAKTEGNSWRAELGHLARHVSESTYKIGLLQGTSSGIREAMIEDIAEDLSGAIIDVVFLAADLGVDIAHKFPETLYERIMENHDDRDDVMKILEGKK